MLKPNRVTLFNIFASRMNKTTFNKNCSIRCFSTSTSCLASPLSNDITDSDSSSSSEVSENRSQHGYETDSNRSFFVEGTDAMAEAPPHTIPEDQLRRYIHDVADINRHPEKAAADGEEETELAEHWLNREPELREELRRRKDAGMIPDSPSDYGYSSASNPESQESGVSNRSGSATAGADTGADNNSGAGITSDVVTATSSALDAGGSGSNAPASSTSTNKRKFEGDDQSSTQPSKSFRQDSSDVTGDTEPFDFSGGDD